VIGLVGSPFEGRRGYRERRLGNAFSSSHRKSGGGGGAGTHKKGEADNENKNKKKIKERGTKSIALRYSHEKGQEKGKEGGRFRRKERRRERLDPNLRSKERKEANRSRTVPNHASGSQYSESKGEEKKKLGHSTKQERSSRPTARSSKKKKGRTVKES